ncbi:MAG: hypothetical protein CMJ46_09580 [Planctomyces sp.]|nr:hypothetical protein [Planctomyces sp.]
MTRKIKISRRETLQAGAISLLGLNLASLSTLKSLSAAEESHADKGAGQYRSCIFIFLFGGPSQLDLWDMKPDAPAEIRGEFQPVATNVPGIQLCEHLPLMAREMDKFCLLRSMTHKMNVHGPACSEIYSGREYFGPPVTDQAKPEDWPSLSSMVTRFGQSHDGLPPAAVLPWYSQFVGQDKRIAGQTGGRMGENWNPFLIQGDMSKSDFEVQGMQLPVDVTANRFARRADLWSRLNELAPPKIASAAPSVRLDKNYDTAWQLIRNAADSNAFSINREPEPLRERYGKTKFGQSLLMARRLVENGIPLVTVNWDDDSKFDKVSPHWDTHHDNFKKLKDGLCPVFDRAYSALIADLADRGLLESTLVVALGEFGRTPRIGLVTQNGMTEPTGRDHWPHAFTALLAGGGVRGGQVYGATNKTAGYVDDKPVTPADLSATILHHLGIDPHLTYYDEFQQVERQLSIGSIVTDLG